MVRIIFIFIFIVFNTLLFSYEGIGKGKSRQESIILALNNISSQIMSTINSFLTIKKKSNTDSYSRDVKQILKSDIVKVTFNGYKIIEERPIKYGYFVKLKVDRNSLLRLYIDRLSRNIRSINEKIESTHSSFKRYSIVKESNLNNLYLQSEIISAIDKSYNIKSYQEKLSSFQKILNKSFTVNVESNNQQAKNVAISILTQKGFIQSKDGNIFFKITLSPFSEHKYLDGDYTLRSDVVISIIENRQTILNKSFLFVAGDIDRFYAERTFFDKLKKRIEKEIKDIL